MHIGRNYVNPGWSGYGYGYGGHYYGTADFLAGLAIGTIIATLPTTCTTYDNGYVQCGNTYLMPEYQGTTVVYVVVNAPQ